MVALAPWAGALPRLIGITTAAAVHTARNKYEWALVIVETRC